MPANFFVGILNHRRKPQEADLPYFTEEAWLDLASLKPADRKECWGFVELPRFKKKLEELKGLREKLVWLFKNLHRLKSRPVKFADSLFDHLFLVTEVSKFTPMERNQYKEAKLVIDAVRDENAIIGYMYDRVVEKATAKGKKLGRIQEAKEIAKAMLAQGLALPLIKKLTKLPDPEILALQG
jgi:predicted transposase/invertase (TIGR01784 family)